MPNRICFSALGEKIANNMHIGFQKSEYLFSRHFTMPTKGEKIILDHSALCYNRIFDCQLSNTSQQL